MHVFLLLFFFWYRWYYDRWICLAYKMFGSRHITNVIRRGKISTGEKRKEMICKEEKEEEQPTDFSSSSFHFIVHQQLEALDQYKNEIHSSLRTNDEERNGVFFFSSGFFWVRFSRFFQVKSKWRWEMGKCVFQSTWRRSVTFSAWMRNVCVCMCMCMCLWLCVYCLYLIYKKKEKFIHAHILASLTQ